MRWYALTMYKCRAILISVFKLLILFFNDVKGYLL